MFYFSFKVDMVVHDCNTIIAQRWEGSSPEGRSCLLPELLVNELPCLKTQIRQHLKNNTLE